MLDDAAQASALQQRLQRQAAGLRVDWVEATGSTNADLLAWVREPGRTPTPRLLLADRQSAGRGRQGRRWTDAAGSSLLLSLAWPLPPRARVMGLSLAVGVWLAQALRQSGCDGVGLKWPNDLLLHGAKLGGVLIELADTEAARWAVVGVGINLRAPQGVAGAAGLDACTQSCARWPLLGALAPALLDGLRAWPETGFAPWVDAWNALHAWAGLAVTVLDNGALQTQGVARGVNDDGCLLLEGPQGLRQVASGDLSLRRAD